MNHARKQVGRRSCQLTFTLSRVLWPTCLRAWFMVCSLSTMKGHIICSDATLATSHFYAPFSSAEILLRQFTASLRKAAAPHAVDDAMVEGERESRDFAPHHAAIGGAGGHFVGRADEKCGDSGK